MTNREKAVITAYTGVCMLYGDEFQHFHKYVAELMGRPVFNYELANKAIWDEIKEKATPDFLKLCAEPECMDLPKVSIQGEGNSEGQEMSGTVYKVMTEMEYKFEIGAIIALLRKLLMATRDYNFAHPKHIGVQVEDVLNFLIDAMVESMKKEKQEDEK